MTLGSNVSQAGQTWLMAYFSRISKLLEKLSAWQRKTVLGYEDWIFPSDFSVDIVTEAIRSQLDEKQQYYFDSPKILTLKYIVGKFENGDFSVRSRPDYALFFFQFPFAVYTGGFVGSISATPNGCVISGRYGFDTYFQYGLFFVYSANIIAVLLMSVGIFGVFHTLFSMGEAILLLQYGVVSLFFPPLIMIFIYTILRWPRWVDRRNRATLLEFLNWATKDCIEPSRSS